MTVTASVSAAARRRMFDAAVQRVERGEHEKQERIRCCVECKIEEAVDQHGKAADQRAGRDAAAKFVACLPPSQPHVKQSDDEEQSQNGADDAAIRKHLQVIVVRLL